MGNKGSKGEKKAKKGAKKGGKKAAGAIAKVERKEFKQLGVDEFDNTFKSIQDPLDTICDLTQNLNDANQSLLDLGKEAEFAGELAEGEEPDAKHMIKVLKRDMQKSGKQFTISFDADGAPSLEADAGGEEEGHIAKTVAALCDLFKAVAEIMHNVPQLLEQMQAAVEQAESLKDNAKSSFEEAGLGAMEMVKAGKNLATNMKYAVGAPNDVKGLLDAVKGIVETINDAVGDFPKETLRRGTPAPQLDD